MSSASGKIYVVGSDAIRMKTEKWTLPSGIVVPVVQAVVTLLPELSRGRSTGYVPHIVIGPQSQRDAILDGNRCTENYLGVMFVGDAETIRPGETAEINLALIYFPGVDYSEVRPGVTFTIREGPRVVGFGVIRSGGWESLQEG